MRFGILSIFILLNYSCFSQNFIKKIFPEDPSLGSYFGKFVAQNNDCVVISSYKDSEKESASGALYFFRNINGDYCQTQKIFPEDATVDQFFGYSIGISNNWVITGAHHDSSMGASSGAAYMLNKNSSNSWSIAQKLIPEDLSEGDEFGKKVDVDGEFAVSSAYLNDEYGINSGVVYLYKIEKGIWKLYSKIHASNPVMYSQFGLSLDINKDNLIVGAPFYENIESGAAYIYQNKMGSWDEVIKLEPDELEKGDQFGITVKINDDYAFIASIKDDYNGENSGAVYVFKKINENWTFAQKIYAPDGDEEDYFGIDIALGDSIVAIGSYFDDDNGENSGSTYIYRVKNDFWHFEKKITPSDGEENDAFASSLSLNNDRLIVGAYSDSDKGFLSGSAYIYSIEDKLINEDFLSMNNIKVFPSIFKNSINIISEPGGTSVRVYTINGTKIKDIFTIERKIKVDLSDFSDGIYIAKVMVNTYSKSYKIIKSTQY